MRLVSVSEKIVNLILGKDVYNESGKLLLGKNIKLTETLIDKLLESEIYTVVVQDEMSDGIAVDSFIDDVKMIAAVSKVKGILTRIARRKENGISVMIPDEEVEAVGNIIKALIEHLEECNDTLYTVVELMGADMYTYQHSVNVAVLTILTCRSLGYDYQLTKHIAMGALLHDIGKSAVKDNLIQKNEPLIEDELQEVFNHVIYGYDMVRDVISLSGYTKQIIRLHHEKRDGSGYPLHLKETDIPDFVRIVTICDMFDAMTSNRVYRRGMPAYKAIEILMADSIYKLDPVILTLFLKNICVYPPGSGVILSDGRAGLVVSYNKYNPTRPVLRVFEDEKGKLQVSHLDLESHRTLFIEEAI
ncbi:MAG: HD-GYP domain-containing protein, partial [Clostridia bacterium]|nr:HD-GYP domain-containing protein [Clostridia bacterium]